LRARDGVRRATPEDERVALVVNEIRRSPGGGVRTPGRRRPRSGRDGVSADAASVPRRTENLVSKLIQICASENDLFGLDVDEGVDHSVDVTAARSRPPRSS